MKGKSLMSLSSARLLLLLLLAAVPAVAGAAGFQDALERPAQASPLAARSLLNGLAAAGQRIVAVGQRGHVVYSDDGGKVWAQGRVPVSSDLVAVTFPTPRQGWAVGHDGVVLHSADGGVTWERQFDGRAAGQAMLDYYTAQAAKDALGPPAQAAALVEEGRRFAAQGPENPFLDVWFADELNGFVVGVFNLIFRTRDGGRSWTPWFDRTDNPKRLHLYGVRGVGGDVYAVGEQGLVLKLDAGAERFRALETPYKGSFFGVTGNAGAVIAFGLRGNALRSPDGGRSWRSIDTGVEDGITGGTSYGERHLVLVSQSGQVLVSRDGGEHFAAIKIERGQPAAAVLAIGQDAVVIAGPRGVRSQALR
jgi:photosystem II stability/assembly factor-like uncharacterized protein